MNLPNKLTMLRIFLVIPIIVIFSIFIWYVYQYLDGDFKLVTYKNNSQYFLYSIAFIFIVSMVTDFIDGKLARKRNLVTQFGKLFDPLADKIIVTITSIFLVICNYTYLILVIILIIRDLIIDGTRNIAASNNLKVAASIWGKLKTLIQSIAIPLILIIIPFVQQNKWWQLFLLNLPMIIATLFSIYSGILYFKEVWPIIKKDK